MHSAMAASVSSVVGVNAGLFSRDGAPVGLSSSAVRFIALTRGSRFGAGGVASRGSRAAAAAAYRVLASSGDSNSSEPKSQTTGTEENVPGWAKPGSEEVPPWAKSERPPSQEPEQDAPFFVYLIGSSLVAIAAVGSVFEYFNKNAVFGVVQPDNFLWAPILGFFVFTGFPSAGFLFYKSITLANKASEDADREDGFSGR